MFEIESDEVARVGLYSGRWSLLWYGWRLYCEEQGLREPWHVELVRSMTGIEKAAREATEGIVGLGARYRHARRSR